MKPYYLLHTKYLDKRAYMKKKNNNISGTNNYKSAFSK